jgi:hypothetical protein
MHKAEAWAAVNSDGSCRRPIPRRDPAPTDPPAGPRKKPAKSARGTPPDVATPPTVQSARIQPEFSEKHSENSAPPDPAPLELQGPGPSALGWDVFAREVAELHAERSAWLGDPPCTCGACRFTRRDNA